VVRIHGLDKVPSTPLPHADGVARPTATPMQALERRVRRAAAARGMVEAVTWSFVSKPQGTDIAGKPAAPSPTVKRLSCRVALIMSALASILVATSGVVGVSSRSISPNSRLTSSRQSRSQRSDRD